MKILRPGQEKVISLLRQSLGKGFKRPVVQCPTGFGKTVVASAIVQGALRKNKRVIFCVPAISLIQQTIESFWEDGIRDIGVIQADHELTNFSKPVQIASVQTLARRRRFPDADIVIVDECHKLFKFYGKWMDAWGLVPFVGLSATPWTKGLGKYYDDLIIGATTQELIDQGLLSDFIAFGPSSPDLSKCRTVAGDYHEGDIADIMDQPPLTADIVINWLKNGENRPTLCFGVDCAHAKHLQQKFDAAGIKTGYIDAYTEIEEREVIKKQFQNGEIQVVCNVGCLTFGIDWDVRCIILARPTKSEILFTQIIGRGLRTADGKDHLIIFDHTNTHENLGYVTDIHHEKLDDGKPKKAAKAKEAKEKLPKKCPSCAFLKPAGVHACPNCLFAPQKQSDIEEAEGELKQIKGKKKDNKNDSPAQKEKFYGELKKYCSDKKYKPGWAARSYREKYGVYPNKYRDAEELDPSPETLMYIKYLTIKNAKRKAVCSTNT